MTRALAADITATLGPDFLVDLHYFVENGRTFIDDDARFVDWLVEDVQQYVHDTYIDTTWPACPKHPNHPLWIRNGWWCCGDDRIAELGSLKSIQPASR
ncbi:MAG: hypothetical protein ACM4AI_26685 [Acidobacteriota bacterium]